jgi:hypothetical protein
VYGILVGKPEGNKPLGRQIYKLVDNIKIDIGDIVWDGVDWIGLAQDRDKLRGLMAAVTNLWIL